MTYNRGRGLSREELHEIAVQHLIRDTEHWDLIVTEADARAALDRMADAERCVGPEVAHRQVWATPVA